MLNFSYILGKVSICCKRILDYDIWIDSAKLGNLADHQSICILILFSVISALLLLDHNLGVSNRTKSNKNPIELNRTIGVRLGSAIEQNRTSILL